MAREPVSRKGSKSGPHHYADGKTWWRIQWLQGGVRRSESVPGAEAVADRRLMKRLQEAEEERVGLRRPTPIVAPTLSELGLRAEREHLPHRQRPDSVIRTLALLARWWEPSLGGRPVDTISVADIRAVLAAIRSKGRTAATANRALAALSIVFEFACELGLIAINPARGRGLRQSEGRKVPRYLSAAEAARVIAESDPEWRAFFATALYTGMRLGELAALRRQDVDLERGVIHVRGSHGNDAPKSGHQRTVGIMAQLRPHIEGLPPGEPTHLVFQGGLRRGAHRADPTGDRIVAPRKALLRALAAAGVKRHLSMHDLRHTFATLYLDAGATPRDLQEALGHSSLAMSSRYAHATGKKLEIKLPGEPDDEDE